MFVKEPYDVGGNTLSLKSWHPKETSSVISLARCPLRRHPKRKRNSKKTTLRAKTLIVLAMYAALDMPSRSCSHKRTFPIAHNSQY